MRASFLFCRRGGLIGLVLLALAAPAPAHDVAQESHDRTIVVRLQEAKKTRKIVFVVEYRLEVTESTAYTDLAKVDPDLDALDFRRQPSRFYERFVREFLPRNLSARLDGHTVRFTCVNSGYTLYDEQKRRLGHLRCDYVFRAEVTAPPAREHKFTFYEGNYLEQTGKVWLTLASTPPIKVLHKVEPDAALLKRQEGLGTELAPGDERKLRTLKVTFTSSADAQPLVARKPPPRAERRSSLLDLFLSWDGAFWVLLLLFVVLGGLHALTPGHGKTLVAAYLVGERGTVWHALLLGLVTTLTHTGVVFAVAIGMYLYFDGRIPTESEQHNVEYVLGLGGGLLVAGLGFWLLLRRLAGKADHFHLGGHGHHHHHHHDHGHGAHAHNHAHGHADHYHDAEGKVRPLPAEGQRVSGWSLVVLGVTGGLVPCWDAVVILIATVGKNALWLTLPLLLAFSAGLAGVLIAIGIAVVYLKGSAASRWGESRFFRALPVLSAALVTGLGIWLCYDTVRTHGTDQDRPSSAAGQETRP